MVAILEKGEFNTDFHPMVDFIVASPLRRNLKLRDEDGIISKPNTELFENLTLMGFNEFSSNIATALVCLATNRTYNFSKMIFDGMVKNVNNKISKFLMYPRIVPLFDTMLVHQGEGSGIPTEPHHIPSSEADTSHPTTSSIPPTSLFTDHIPPVTQTDTTPIRQYSRRARIAQSSAPLTVADEPVSPMRDVSKGEACPTFPCC
nr:synaptobrevin, longin-like domain protein [Tanacetum cinerariifolium]